MTFKIEFTDLAKGFAVKVGGLVALEEQVRSEIADLGRCYCGECDGFKGTDGEDHGALDDINSLIMHVVMMKDDRGESVDFICTPGAQDVLHVDTTTFEELDPLDRGPFKGKVVMMPRGDSDD